MCTVSYIPKIKGSGFILTSNRDEKVKRLTEPPRIYKKNSTTICYPKDTLAGGSWIATSKKGRLCCLLNGGFIAHKRQENYAESRGNVLLEVVSSPLSAETYFKKKKLHGIEPFTTVSVEKDEDNSVNLTEFVWDGHTKHFRVLDPNKAHIWSSATLYNKSQQESRKKWFNAFLKENATPVNAKSILNFHLGTHTNNNELNIVMERSGGLKTVSLTQVVSCKNKLKMKYLDLHLQHETNVEL